MMQPAPQQTWAPARQPQRNVAAIVVGGILLFIALGAGFVFFLNLYQYLTVEDRWAHERVLTPEMRAFGVRIVREASMKRILVFGPISGLSGIGGVVLGVLGLRKK
jgi:hypothetical protein